MAVAALSPAVTALISEVPGKTLFGAGSIRPGYGNLNRHQFSRHFPAVLDDAFHTLPATAVH